MNRLPVDRLLILGLPAFLPSAAMGGGPLDDLVKKNVEETAVETYHARIAKCIDAEAKRVAPKSIDLETAAYAVIGGCRSEIDAAETAYGAAFSDPDDKREIEVNAAAREAIRWHKARELVAVARSQ
jgi:hypothetical protein